MIDQDLLGLDYGHRRWIDPAKSIKPWPLLPVSTSRVSDYTITTDLVNKTGRYLTNDEREAAAFALNILPEALAIIRHPNTIFESADFRDTVREFIAKVKASGFEMLSRTD